LLSDKGNEIAQYFLGSMLIMPIDNTINADFEKGLTYLMLSGKRGYIPALEYLGNLYAYSNLIEKNPKTAHTFFYLVSLSKENVDIGYHQIIEDEFKLSRNEIQSSIKNATECLEKGFDTCYIFN
jgi:TPR repeat protein